MYIKHLKPKKNGRFKQGYINPESCKKLYENLKNEPIIYRSSWERRFITWCESSPKVVAWGSECIHIPYYNPVDQKTHNYYPDFVVELVNGDKLVVEIKPENQTVRPALMLMRQSRLTPPPRAASLRLPATSTLVRNNLR